MSLMLLAPFLANISAHITHERKQCDISNGRLHKIAGRPVVLILFNDTDAPVYGADSLIPYRQLTNSAVFAGNITASVHIMCIENGANLSAPTAPCVLCDHSFFITEIDGDSPLFMAISHRETLMLGALLLLMVAVILANDTVVACVRRLRCCYTLTRIRSTAEDV
jgi:hypothetical protein